MDSDRHNPDLARKMELEAAPLKLLRDYFASRGMAEDRAESLMAQARQMMDERDEVLLSKAGSQNLNDAERHPISKQAGNSVSGEGYSST
jgi:hypothetical protein